MDAGTAELVGRHSRLGLLLSFATSGHLKVAASQGNDPTYVS
jgi:hypothetical protein